MSYRIAAGALLAGALVLTSALAKESLESGPQTGGKVTPFNPLHVTGPDEGKKLCLV